MRFNIGMSAVRIIFQTDGYGGLIARLFLGAVMLPHGFQKIFTVEQTMNSFTSKMDLPYVVAVLVIAGESVGAVSLIIGFMSRFCALSMGIIMIGAVHMFHLRHGFFMNWKKDLDAGQGYEYHLLMIGLALVVVVCGGGKLSVDRVIGRMSSS
ncbi:MAG: DoxX family protein [Thermodesulfobacteriota bacterium]